MKHIFEESEAERNFRIKGSKDMTIAMLRGGLLSLPFYFVFCFYNLKWGGTIRDILLAGAASSGIVCTFTFWAWIYRKCPRTILITDKYFEIKSMVEGQKIKWKHIKELKMMVP